LRCGSFAFEINYQPDHTAAIRRQRAGAVVAGKRTRVLDHADARQEQDICLLMK
jgi:hypothetical protein